MTIEEVIIEAKEVAEKRREESKQYSEYSTECSICEKAADKHEHLAEWLEELKAYKDAEKQGLLLRLPCKVGDKVYQIEDGYIYEFNARSIDVRKENEKYIFCIDSMDYIMDDFGKTVFLTKEEAEQALKQMGE